MANLITLQEYKDAMNVQTTEFDGQLKALLPMISDAIKIYCGQEFARDTYTEKNNGIINYEGYYMFFVNNLPIVTVNSILLNFYGTQTSISIDTTQLDVREKEGYVVYAGALNPGQAVLRPEYANRFHYTIEYVGGYLTVPSQVKMACIYALSDNFSYNYSNKIASGESSMQQETKQMKIDEYSITQTTSLDKLDKIIMDNVNGVMFSPTVKSLLNAYSNLGQSGGF